MPDPLIALKQRLSEVHNLNAAASVLDWDQQTQMPTAGIAARAEQKATLAKISHQMFTSQETQQLLADAEGVAGSVDPASDDAALIRIARRDLDKATKLPTSLVTELSRTTSLAQEAWAGARASNDYPTFAPWLEKIVRLNQHIADALGYDDRRYDALVDQYETGMTARVLDGFFTELKRELLPLTRAVFERADAVDASPLHGVFDEERQRLFIEGVLTDCGFDFQRGRQDRAVHPFCTSFSQNDVRITTRYDREFLPMALFGSLHEMGHALYELGVDPSLEGTLLSNGTSLGVHESQSRLWENLVGRGRPFWKHYYSRIQETFPASLGSVAPEAFYRAINRVAPTLIRVEADELTYNLHIVLRYELENELLEGRLSVADAPEAWNAKMENYLGQAPPTDTEGILQDVHWSLGILGYFPTYSLGNVLSVQFFEQARADLPQMDDDLAAGRFSPLREWLRENVHRPGRKIDPIDLVQKVTGNPLTPEVYLRYLRTKFGEIYGR